MPDIDVRGRIQAGDTVLGTFLFAFPSTAAARAAVGAGADFVLVDGEHTGFGWETMTPVLTATRAAGAAPFVRIPAASRQNVSLALDMGAVGIVVPMVATAEEAASIASWSRYPPDGVRGAMFGLAAHDYLEVDPAEAMATSNAETIVIVQIETVDGLENVEAIAATPGVDVIWVGHYDLTISMGIPSDFSNPRYIDAIARVVAAARSHSKALGFLVSGPDHARMLSALGFTVFAYGSDVGLYRQALRTGLTAIADAVG